MIAIRGATTVDCDRVGNIRESVKELMVEIFRRNGLNEQNVVCIIFSSTMDLRSYYPATAAREVGFGFCPLFSAAEPDIQGALPKCIRVMALAETQSKPVHVYLKGAKILRKDLRMFNVAIDGPAGSGKSTVSKILGKKLNILCLDTGAMYRACALKCIKEGIRSPDEKSVSKFIGDINIQVKYENGAQKTFLDGVDVSEEIRLPGVSMLASDVSAIGCVREKMVALQREIASKNSCILDGRDIGTNVLPNAEFKFYLTASVAVRAKRRFEENKSKGFEQSYSEISDEIIKRDEQDKNRKIAPLIKADDALLIDSSDMTVEEVVGLMEKIIREKLK